MRYYTNILLGKNSVCGRPSCTLFRSRVLIMTTLDHAVEEVCRRILLEAEEEEGEGGRMRRDKFHVFMSAVKMAFHIVSSGKSHFTLCRRHLVKHVFLLLDKND